MLFIAAFIWQARIGCYSNGLIDVKEKLKILKRFLTTQAEIKPSCHHMSWGEIVQILPQGIAIIRKYHLRDDNCVMKNVCQDKHKTKIAKEQENVLKKRIVHRSK